MSQLNLDNDTPTTIRTLTAEFVSHASPRTSGLTINRPLPRSALMNPPTVASITESDMADVTEAYNRAIVDGTVRMICY